MSRSIDLFIDSDLPLHRLASQIAEVTGTAVTRSGVERYTVRSGDVVAELYEHQCLESEDLPLSQYRYVLSSRCRTESVAQSFEAGWLSAIADTLKAFGFVSPLLVIDLEMVDESSSLQESGLIKRGPEVTLS